MKKKTILIFGISSFVGSNLAEFFKKDYKVVGTYYRTPVHLQGIPTIPCNVLEKSEVQLALFAFKPDIAIYAIGLSSLLDCDAAPGLADALNTSGLFIVADYCQRYKSQLCYLSSAYVFDGKERDYVERDIPDANTIYGKTKASAEFYIQRTSLNYLIFRCCALYGRSSNSTQFTWFEKLQKRMYKGESISCDDHILVGFIDVVYLAMIMKICFEDISVANRLFQVSSSNCISYYDFAKLHCKIFKESVSNVYKTKWKYPVMKTASETYSGEDLFFKLDLLNIEGFLNMRMPSVEESLQFTYKRFNGEDRRSREKSGIITYI